LPIEGAFEPELTLHHAAVFGSFAQNYLFSSDVNGRRKTAAPFACPPQLVASAGGVNPMHPHRGHIRWVARE
jgi:hypothetical protein